jgi:ATP-dependent DNA helicase RecG
MPPPPITLEQMQSFTAPMLSRNPELHFVFARIGMAEEQGLGLGSLRDRAKELELPLPKYTWDAPYLVLTLYRSVQGAMREYPEHVLDSMNEDEKRGWKFLATRTTCTRAQYEAHMRVDTRKAQRQLKRFVQLGLLRKIGASASTYYEIQRP